MAIHDTIGDFLTFIRNASRAGKPYCEAPFSKMRLAIAKTLHGEGLIRGIEEKSDTKGRKLLVLRMKYKDGIPAITNIQRHSRPGCRLYYSYREIPRVLNGLGISILTTSRGILKDAEARQQKIGGEVLCTIW